LRLILLYFTFLHTFFFFFLSGTRLSSLTPNQNVVLVFKGFNIFRPEGSVRFIAPEYGCITPLRVLTLRERNPELWERLQLLMDHDEDRKKEVDYQQMFQVRQ
jgi:hypothetical protein